MTFINAALAAVSVFLALNMGGSGLAPSFSSALGARLVERRATILLFSVFVTLGALLFGGYVTHTLGRGLVPAQSFNPRVALIVISSAAASLFIANMLRIPQSTSWVTVFSISSIGLLHGNLNYSTILHKLLPAWILLPALCFVTTLVLLRIFYPLRKWNFGYYEQLSKHEWKMKVLVLSGSCYVALAIGSNNVANVVGPLSAAGVIEPLTGLALAAPVFGVGAALFRTPAQTVSKEIVPIGLFAATVINLITATFLLAASLRGIPQSLVQMNAAAVFATCLVKDGTCVMAEHRVIRKMLLLWLVTPLIASAITFIAMEIFT
jgi:phosphate/sulfate permease